ncbi:hypothetical protein M0802_013953, partial [Mischocyttarus mexicanus]
RLGKSTSNYLNKEKLTNSKNKNHEQQQQQQQQTMKLKRIGPDAQDYPLKVSTVKTKPAESRYKEREKDGRRSLWYLQEVREG